MEVKDFILATASGEPVPGGGSISALCASLSAALTAMVAKLTLGKKKYAEVQDSMQTIADKLTMASESLYSMIDLDAEAYQQVFQAYKLPKETDQQKEKRDETIQRALHHAASVPLGVVTIVQTFLADIEEVARSGNQNAITDAYVAALCARTAVRGAGANVLINLTTIRDNSFVEDAKKVVEQASALADATEHTVKKLLEKALN